MYPYMWLCLANESKSERMNIDFVLSNIFKINVFHLKLPILKCHHILCIFQHPCIFQILTAFKCEKL